VTKKPLILVTGATGFVGREAVAQWVDAVKAGKMFFPPTVKQLLGRPGHSFDD
jgi:hypothetical protein